MPLLLAVGVFLLAAAFALTPLQSHDLWWHLRAGELILETGRPPTRNLFSFTAPDHPWVAHEWLTEALLFWVYSRVGPGALVALKALLVGSAFTVVAVTAWRESRSLWAAAGISALAAWSARFTFDIRPQLITYLFLAVTLAMVSRHRRIGDRWIFALVPLFCLWANLHSGFIAGLIVLALAGVTMPERRRGFLGVMALGTVAALATPYHWRGLWFPLDVSRTRLFTDTLTEWFSPDFHSSWLTGFEILILGGPGLLAVSPTRPTLFEMGLLLGLGHLSLQHQRHVPLFAIAAAPMFARHLVALAKPLAGSVQVPLRLSLAAAALGVAAAAGVLCGRLPRGDALAAMTCRDAFPVEAAAYLQRQPPLRLFNAYVWGGYLIRFCPAQPVFIDGRADAYPRQVLSDYLNIERLQPGWEELLANYRINAIVYQKGTPFAAALRRSPDWRVAYSDAVAEVFLRRGPARQDARKP